MGITTSNTQRVRQVTKRSGQAQGEKAVTSGGHGVSKEDFIRTFYDDNMIYIGAIRCGRRLLHMVPVTEELNLYFNFKRAKCVGGSFMGQLRREAQLAACS